MDFNVVDAIFKQSLKGGGGGETSSNFDLDYARGGYSTWDSLVKSNLVSTRRTRTTAFYNLSASRETRKTRFLFSGKLKCVKKRLFFFFSN